jgi:ribosomal protein S16
MCLFRSVKGKKGSLIIRLRRHRRQAKVKRNRNFTIVVARAGSRGTGRTGLVLDTLGYMVNEGDKRLLFVNGRRLGSWLNKGAKLT